jgi:hypothetical protein
MSREPRTACRCPYCDAPMAGEDSLCKPCGVAIDRCGKCGKPLPRGAKTCPACGTAGTRPERSNQK